VSPKWIFSLFHSDTARLTPLDFRLTAAAQFRLLSATCSLAGEGLALATEVFLGGQLNNVRIMSRKTLNNTLHGIVIKFKALIEVALLSNRAPQFIMAAIKIARISSAVHTNTFQISVPGSNEYETVDNFYPLHENVSFTNVSHRPEILCIR
jgi:hypothetical protein